MIGESNDSPRPVEDILVSGANYGENLGADITIDVDQKAAQLHGSSSSTAGSLKSSVLRVTRISPCVRAVADSKSSTADIGVPAASSSAWEVSHCRESPLSRSSVAPVAGGFRLIRPAGSAVLEVGVSTVIRGTDGFWGLYGS